MTIRAEFDQVSVGVQPISAEDLSVVVPAKKDGVRPDISVDRDISDLFDDFNPNDELIRLERRSMVVEALRGMWTGFADMDTTVARRVSGVMMRNDNPYDAFNTYREMPAETQSQLYLRDNLAFAEFSLIYELLHEMLTSQKEPIEEAVYKRTHFSDKAVKSIKSQILWNDLYEMKQTPRRSLEQVKEAGITITIPQEFLPLLRSPMCTVLADGACPVLEKIKNDRIFTISGLKGSKASLTIHDLFDHYWSYDLFERKGIFRKYREFFDRVGNPQATDMFKRESELLASTVYATRLFAVSESEFKPIFTIDQVRRVLLRAQNSEVDETRTNVRDALKILDGLEPGSNEERSLVYDVSNMAIELMEQRRKHGHIKLLEMGADGTREPVGIMPILDPNYIALMVETHHMILDPSNCANEALISISAIVEDYLWDISKQDESVIPDPLVVKIEDIQNFDVRTSSLPPKRIKWLIEKAGFASTKASLC